MTDTVQKLLRDRVGDPAPAVKYGGRVWTWAEHLDEAARQASSITRHGGPIPLAIRWSHHPGNRHPGATARSAKSLR